MPQFLKLMLYNEINLSVRFQDYFSHVWEHSRFIIQTVIKQTLLHKEALSPFSVKSMGEMYQLHYKSHSI